MNYRIGYIENEEKKNIEKETKNIIFFFISVYFFLVNIPLQICTIVNLSIIFDCDTSSVRHDDDVVSFSLSTMIV